MMVPRKNEFELWEDIFNDSFFNHKESRIMKTDIKEYDDNYSINIELPGYVKDDIKIDVNNGYLTINAVNSSNNQDEEGKFVRRERYYGECFRSFYIGEQIESEDIKASFKNGILKLIIPKKEVKNNIENKKYIQIDEE